MMFCPEDGTSISIGGGIGVRGGQTIYPPCPTCHTRWKYDGENGRYEVFHYPEDMPAKGHSGCYEPVDYEEPADDLPDLEEMLRATGASHRALGIDTLVANIVDTMEKKARLDGKCTYYMGTYAVARETLATAGLTCENDPSYHGLPPDNRLRWLSFFGDDWEYLTRQEAIEVLLAERS